MRLAAEFFKVAWVVKLLFRKDLFLHCGRHWTVLIIALFATQNFAQVFIPMGMWVDSHVSFSALTDLEGPQFVTVSHAIVVTNKSTPLTCSSSHFTATTSNPAVLSLANITFSGTFPNCVISYTSSANSGTSDVTIRLQNAYNQSITRSFTFTAYAKPAMAFSFRKVVKDYIGSAIRVRRISDNAEQDIGFDVSGNLDSASYTAFQGGSSLRLTIWYDQSGNGYNATQPTTTLQPTINLTGFNGAPQVQFANTYWLQTTQAQNILNSLTNVTIFYGTKAISEARTIFGLRLASNNRVGAHLNWSDGVFYWDSPGTCCANSRLSLNNSANANLAAVYVLGRNGANQYIKINGTNLASRSNASGSLTAGTAIWYLGATNNLGSAAEIASSPLAEYVQYTAGLTDAQVTAISNEQKSYFGL